MHTYSKIRRRSYLLLSNCSLDHSDISSSQNLSQLSSKTAYSMEADFLNDTEQRTTLDDLRYYKMLCSTTSILFFSQYTLTHENFRNRHIITNLLIYSLYFCSLAYALYTQPKIHLSSDLGGGSMVVPVGSAQKLFSLMALDGIAKMF